MAENLLSQGTPSEDGRSDFERGTSLLPFRNGPAAPPSQKKPEEEKDKQASPASQYQSDQYPTHDKVWDVNKAILKSVTDKKIPLAKVLMSDHTRAQGSRINATAFDSTPGFAYVTPKELAALLAVRQYKETTASRSKPNSEWLGGSIDPGKLETAIEDALLASWHGFLTPDGWTNWAGTHWGRWYQDDSVTPLEKGVLGPPRLAPGGVYLDKAFWFLPRKQLTRDPPDIDKGTKKSREYDYQQVEWTYRVAGRDGWNLSHPEVPFIWGWDPKEWNPREWDMRKSLGAEEDGDIAPHVGYPFSMDRCHFIVWLTPFEVFFEGVNLGATDTVEITDVDLGRKHLTNKGYVLPESEKGKKTGHPKTSVGLGGRGQWVVEPWK
jgi:hypothetical protein